jgi:hypothetical protein
MRAVYRAETAEMAEQRLAKFEAEWGKKYPPIGLAWRRVWNEVIPCELTLPKRQLVLLLDGYWTRRCLLGAPWHAERRVAVV